MHVGDVAAETEDGALVEFAKTLYVCEAGEGAIGCYCYLLEMV